MSREVNERGWQEHSIPPPSSLPVYPHLSDSLVQDPRGPARVARMRAITWQRAQMFVDFHIMKDIYKGLSFAKVINGLIQIRDSRCKASQRSQMVYYNMPN